jgi:citrate lyase subunit beta/citryl-CoA lyase
VSRLKEFPLRWLSLDLRAGDASPARALAADFDALVLVGPARAAAPVVAAARASRPDACLFCTVSLADSAVLEDELDALVRAPPDGVVLSACRGRADIQQMSTRLALCEARAGFENGRIGVIASVAQTPDAVLGLAGLAGASRRLAGVALDPGLLPRAMGGGFGPDSMAVATARSLVAFAAAAAGVPALVYAQSVPPDALDAFCARMRSEGFTGAITGNPDQWSRIAAIFRGRPS